MDQFLFFQINRHWTAPWLDLPMAAISSWDFWWPIAVIGGLIAFFFGGFRGRAALVCVGLAVGMTDALVVDTMKDITQRPRPHQVLEGVRILDLQKATPRLLALAKPVKLEMSEPSIHPMEGNSFPSGHASNNFALATVLILFYRRWGWIYLIPASLVSYSRIYVGSHYPSDIVVSILLGVGIALLVVAGADWLWRRWAAVKLPNLFAAHPTLTGP